MSSSAKNGTRVALVTGATGGIGRAVVRQLTDSGVRCIGLASGPDEANGIWACNVADEQDVERVVNRIREEFGRLDILVNCAGVAVVKDDFSLVAEDWERVLSVNLTGTYLCCKHAFGLMAENGFGRIVNIGSIAGRQRSKTASVAYTCSKYGIVGLTRQLAAKVGDSGVTINCVAPSQVDTPMLRDNVSRDTLDALIRTIPVGRLATPEDVAGVICFLVGDGAGYVNGAVIDVNGGQL